MNARLNHASMPSPQPLVYFNEPSCRLSQRAAPTACTPYASLSGGLIAPPSSNGGTAASVSLKPSAILSCSPPAAFSTTQLLPTSVAPSIRPAPLCPLRAARRVSTPRQAASRSAAPTCAVRHISVTGVCARSPLGRLAPLAPAPLALPFRHDTSAPQMPPLHLLRRSAPCRARTRAPQAQTGHGLAAWPV